MVRNMKRKTEKQSICKGNCDMISNLPDCVLSRILSFLPSIRNAIATNILSKRWIYVWTFVDKLVFQNNGQLLIEDERFTRFVYKVLELHQGDIKEFTLTNCGLYGGLDVVSWINTATSMGLERLNVGILFAGATPKWPLSIFTCNTLVEVSMWCLIRNNIDIPSTPIFPCLKKLRVPMFGCDGGILKSIVIRCLALEHLIVGSCQTTVDIVSYSMKRLSLRCTSKSPDRKTVLCAHTLRSSENENILKPVCDSVVRFIQLLSNVKLLRIHFLCEKFFNSVGHGLFPNLIKLELVSSFFEWRLLLSLMESSVNLEAITLRKTSTPEKHKLAWKDPKKVPACVSSSIKKISIEGYSEAELPMVKYVLRTAQTLERVDIHCAESYSDNNDWKSDMLQKLQQLRRACERCEIVLV